jgi:hypothetical protein
MKKELFALTDALPQQEPLCPTNKYLVITSTKNTTSAPIKSLYLLKNNLENLCLTTAHQLIFILM